VHQTASSDLLLSYPITSLSSPMTNIRYLPSNIHIYLTSYIKIPESARDTEAAMRNNNSNTIGNANMPSPYPTPRPVALSNNAMASNGPSTPAAGAKVPTVSGSRKNASRARVSDEDTNPKYGVGNQEMPTFDRNVLTSTIKATTYVRVCCYC